MMNGFRAYGTTEAPLIHHSQFDIHHSSFSSAEGRGSTFHLPLRSSGQIRLLEARNVHPVALMVVGMQQQRTVSRRTIWNCEL